MARLSIINNGHLVRSVELGAGEMSIGRGDDVAIQLKHPLISRHHARLFLTPGGYVVEDEGTKNGTFVAGRRVQQHQLDDGDELEIADFILQYHAEGFRPPGAGNGSSGMVAKDRKVKKEQSPLEAYMEALKRGGSNATAAIPPSAMAKLREQARQRATPRIRVGDEPPRALADRINTIGWTSTAAIRLPGRWLWVKDAAQITRSEMTLRVQKLSRWVGVRVNGEKVREAELKFGDRVRIGKHEIVVMEGDISF